MNQRASCPYCGERVSDEAVRLWDGRRYCRSCVESVSPELYSFARNGGQLVEVVEKSDASLKQYLRGAGYKTLVVGFVIFMVPMIVLAMMDKPNARFDLLFAVCFFWSGFILGYLVLKSLLWSTRAFLPRTIAVEQNQVLLITPRGEKKYPLDECRWELKGIYRDGLTAFTGLRKGIVIVTADSYLCCGHSPEMLKHWGAFLLLAGVRRKSYWNYLRTLLISVAGLLIGFLLGYCLGQTMALMTNDPFWSIAIAILGCVDGGGIAFNYAYYTNIGRTATFDKISPAAWWGMFFVVSIKIFISRGMVVFLICSALNGAMGAFAAWYIRKYLCAGSDQQKSEERQRHSLKEVLEDES